MCTACLQAQARAHRIGQARDVLVLRLLAANTIEEHILDVAEQKRKFADSSITGAHSVDAVHIGSRSTPQRPLACCGASWQVLVAW